MKFKSVSLCTLACALPLLVVVPSYAAHHGDHGASSLMIESPWVRAVPPVSKMTAGYLELHNMGDKERRLVSASANISKKVELHISEPAKNGKGMAMRQVPYVSVPAKGMTALKPGSYHVMFMGLHRSLAVGEPVEITLTFANGEQQTVTARVSSAPHTPKEGEGHGMEHKGGEHSHGGMSHSH